MDNAIIYMMKTLQCKGEMTRKVYRLGEPVNIRVSKVDMYSRNIDFVLAE